MPKHQQQLFDVDMLWESEWKEMPEFVQEDLTSHRKLIVHFRNDEDVKRFAELLKQHITPKQKALWFPEYEIRRYRGKKYVDESTLSDIHNFKGQSK